MHNKICNNGKVSKCLLILLFCFLFASCKDKKTIIFGLDKYEQASASDFTCSCAFTEWNGNPNYYYEVDSDITFHFLINKDNPFVRGLKDFYGITFVFELDNIQNTLREGFMYKPYIENDSVTYVVALESLEYNLNPKVVSFKEIKDENEKIKAFKDILENCSIYAINPDNEKMRIKFTRDTEVIMRRLDIE